MQGVGERLLGILPPIFSTEFSDPFAETRLGGLGSHFPIRR